MKQFEILSGRCLVVELPKQDFIKAKIQTLVDLQTVWSGKLNFNKGDGWESVSFPPGNWRIIGMLSGVTEEQVIPIVERESKPEYSYEQEYPEYVGDEWWYRDYQAQGEGDYKYGHYTALESLESAILAEGYYLDENPIEYPSQSDPKFYDEPYDGTGFYQEIYSSAINDWQVAQSRVIDRSRCLLLRREVDKGNKTKRK